MKCNFVCRITGITELNPELLGPEPMVPVNQSRIIFYTVWPSSPSQATLCWANCLKGNGYSLLQSRHKHWANQPNIQWAVAWCSLELLWGVGLIQSWWLKKSHAAGSNICLPGNQKEARRNPCDSCYTLSPRRPYEEYKRMVLEHTHGLFIT
jgi:hypothetical protein